MEGFRLSRGAHKVRVFARALAAKASRVEGVRVSDPEGKDDGGEGVTAYCVECNDVLTSDDDQICGFCEDYVSFESDPNWNKVPSEEDEEDGYSSSSDMEVTSSRRPDCDPKSNSFGASMMRIKAGGSVRLSTQCDFGDAQQTTETLELLDHTTVSSVSEDLSKKSEDCKEPSEMKENTNLNKSTPGGKTNEILTDKVYVEKESCKLSSEQLSKKDESISERHDTNDNKESVTSTLQEVCTPKPPTVVEKGCQASTVSKRQQTAKKIASALKNPSALKSKVQSHLSHSKSVKPASIRRDASNKKSSVGTPNLVQENQAIKRQKLDNDKTRQ
ncbi:hypothetical protein RND81_14G064700 [Saponaria officinalis]